MNGAVTINEWSEGGMSFVLKEEGFHPFNQLLSIRVGTMQERLVVVQTCQE